MGYVSTAEIPIFTGISLGQMLSDTITEYFADPIHQKEFEEWRSKRANEKNDCINNVHTGSSIVDFRTNGAGRRGKNSAVHSN